MLLFLDMNLVASNIWLVKANAKYDYKSVSKAQSGDLGCSVCLLELVYLGESGEGILSSQSN